MEKFDTLDSSEKTILILGDRWCLLHTIRRETERGQIVQCVRTLVR